ncbi:hypothetical protein B0T17DRAFT_652979 [Bombardia bombarda]|uniref:Uncharacterized protein n=1 Tax=Bombardia bombarda TaxID=252184 RepID=A0AA39X8U8_9PEZI|nr:hypothetical protein B0T17DRAFT_652979 [Bombardia bombarda]
MINNDAAPLLREAPTFVPPTRFLLQPARPAMMLYDDVHTDLIPRASSLRPRDSVGPTCASNETKCLLGDWCCNLGETCSFDNGAFFCCASGAANNQGGCARVCGIGDFQCGSICCANGQTCMGDGTPSPYCINSTSSTAQSTIAPALQTTNTQSSHVSPTSHTSDTKDTTNKSTPTQTSTSTSPASVSSSPAASANSLSGMSVGSQIAMGVVVPIVVIVIVAALWLLIFRRPSRQRPRTRGTFSSQRPSYYPPTPPPAYTKNSPFVSVVGHGGRFPPSASSSARGDGPSSPVSGVSGSGVDEAFEMAPLAGGGETRRPEAMATMAVISLPPLAVSSAQGERDSSPVAKTPSLIVSSSELGLSHLGFA